MQEQKMIVSVGEQIDLGFVNCLVEEIRNCYENKKERKRDWEKYEKTECISFIDRGTKYIYTMFSL
jgi:hypothetical protein